MPDRTSSSYLPGFFRRISALVGVIILISGCSQVSPASRHFDIFDKLGFSKAKEEKPIAALFPPSAPGTALPAPPMEANSSVRRAVNLLLRGDGAFIKKSLERRQEHYETITAILKDEGIPLELTNLALIESGFRCEARSYAGAVGMWQFTRSTAKRYGLVVSGSVDQRKDPILSTLAAARMLRDLYRTFQDWYLVLAAYNAGPGAVNRALQRSGSDNFWGAAKSGGLSGQTKEFVPKFIAATLLVRAYEKHGPDNLSKSVALELDALESSGRF
ncbi:MAG: hypothetical protein DCC75_12905, partial [Proteobacteria bacterium]